MAQTKLRKEQTASELTTKVGTPVDNQVAVWTGDGTIEGTNALTFNGAADKFSISAGGTFDVVTTNNGGYVDMIDGGTGGNIYLEYSSGDIYSKATTGNTYGILRFSGINTSNKTFTFPNTSGTIALTANPTDITVPDEAYGAGWNGSTEVPTKNAVYDKIETLLPLAGGTLTGNITLGENTSIDLDPAGSADGKYSGICITGTAGAALAFGDLIYLAAADSRWELADADAASTSDRLLGICVLAAASDGSATKILLQGNIRADAAFPALTIGSPVYVGETPGDVQTAIPTGADAVIRRVGFALTADELYFNPSMDAQTVVA